MKIHKNNFYFFILIIALLFVGSSIVYNANITKNINAINDNEKRINNEENFDSLQEINKLNSQIINLSSKIEMLSNSNKNSSLKIEQHVVGGGYEYATTQSSRKRCDFWGKAKCSNFYKIICPENYTKFSTGEKGKVSDNEDNSEGFLCVK